MSQINEVTTNGPTQHIAPKQDIQEGVKVVPGNNNNPITQLQQQGYVQISGPQLNDPNRPVLRRVDSRGQFPYRQPSPQQPGQPQIPLRPPQPIRPQPPPGTFQRPPVPVQQPRFPTPIQPRPENPRPSISPENQFPRPIRPPISPRGPTPQRPQIPENDTKPNLSQIRNQSFSTSRNSDMSPSVDRDDLRSSSSLGFHDNEKDIDTSALNGKTSSHEDIHERPESRSGINKEQKHGSMHKIDEDDDDLITPNRKNSTVTPPKDIQKLYNPEKFNQDAQKYQEPQKDLQKGYQDNQKMQDAQKIHQDPPKVYQEPQKVFPSDTQKYNQEPLKTSYIQDSQKTSHNQEPVKTTYQDLQKSSYNQDPQKVLHSQDSQKSLYNQDTKPYTKSPEPNKNIPKTNYTSEYSTEKSPIDTNRYESSKLSSDTRRYSTEKLSDANRFKMNNDEDVVTASMIEPQNLTTLPPQKPTNLPKNIKNDTWANEKESRSILKSKSPVKNDKKIISPRTEINNYSNRRPFSGRYRSGEGDNDSGVDESTQGNDQSCNGDNTSPKKTQKSSRSSSASKAKTPTKSIQSPKSPETANSIPAEKKKVPMNKVHVGNAPSPNLKVIKSKIGSLENATHKPGGGHVKIENKKLDFAKVSPRIAAKNDAYQPHGGEKKIVQQKLQWNAKSKIGSLENANYKPKGGDKKIESVKLDFKEKAKPKVGSKDNMKHVPGGGDVKIETQKLEIKAQSKVGSLNNVKHKPGGGDVKIFDDKEYLRQRAASSADHHSNSALSGSQNSLRSQQSQPEPAEPISDENLNQER